MPRLGIAILIAAAVACSKASSQQQTAAANVTGNACDRKLLTLADIGDLLGSPATTMEPLRGDPQTCQFKAAGAAYLTVSLRPTLGDVTVQTWLDGKMPIKATPLSGVGDKAAWVSDLTEVVATKANLLCDIQVNGASGDKTVVQAKTGALCNTIYQRSR
jgi:hypothetical protein